MAGRCAACLAQADEAGEEARDAQEAVEVVLRAPADVQAGLQLLAQHAHEHLPPGGAVSLLPQPRAPPWCCSGRCVVRARPHADAGASNGMARADASTNRLLVRVLERRLGRWCG